jgi:hypothetical protein
VTTEDGFLTITTRAEKTFWQDWDNDKMVYVTSSKNYTSGMLQSWNKMCFTGGVLELAVQLPGGRANASGLWPAAWLMGNLARATYQETTTNFWPWSYNTCGDIPNLDDKQQINACNSASFPEVFGLNPHQGRGAPEIDIFEVMMGHEMPDIPAGVDPTKVSPPFTYKEVNAFMSNSLQIAPGKAALNRPINGVPLGMNQSSEWYGNIYVSNKSSLNYAFYGEPAGPEGKSYMEDSVSANTGLEDTNFLEPHIYRLEWQPGSDGYLHWYLDNIYLFGIEAAALKAATGAIIPEEPSYLILNTAVSHVWGFPEPCDSVSKSTCDACWMCYDCTNPDCQCSLPENMRGCKNFPAVMKVDYIRVYQDLDDPLQTLGCSPASHPTADFIANHPDRYADWSPLEPVWFSLFETIVRILVLLVLLLSLVYSARYLCNPRYRTIGNVGNVKNSGPDVSPKKRAVELASSRQNVSPNHDNMASETTNLLSPA